MLTADLTGGPGRSSVATAQAEDVMRINKHGGSLRRTGRWVVPRRLELRSSSCDVGLDFANAVITRDTVRIDMDVRGGSLILLVGPGTVVDADSLRCGTPTSRSARARSLVHRSFFACSWLAVCATARSRRGGRHSSVTDAKSGSLSHCRPADTQPGKRRLTRH